VGIGALRTVVAILFIGFAAWGPGPATAQPDPFVAMNALRVTPPVAAPDVRFDALVGRPVSLKAFRGRPVLLTFFTTW
jgi:cytochrome oxidase Cu insertion factor (SCO1/SenC/PrrC family)